MLIGDERHEREELVQDALSLLSIPTTPINRDEIVAQHKAAEAAKAAAGIQGKPPARPSKPGGPPPLPGAAARPGPTPRRCPAARSARSGATRPRS